MVQTAGFDSKTKYSLNSRVEGSKYLAMKSKVQDAKKAAAGSGYSNETAPDGFKTELVTSPKGKSWDQINGSFIVEHAYAGGRVNLQAQLETYNGIDSHTTYKAEVKTPFETQALVERQVPGEDQPYTFSSDNPKLTHAIVNKTADHIQKTRQAQKAR